MNEIAATHVIEAIGSIYPSYRPMNIEVAVRAWMNIFHDVSEDVVMAALYSYSNSNHEFAPTPGQLREIINDATNPYAMNDEQAWDMVRKATENGLYGSEKEFDKLPEIIQRTLGSPHAIYSMAMLDATSLTVEKSHFLKAYRAEVERREHIDNLPNTIKGRIEQIRNGMPAIENKQEVAMIEQRNFYTDAAAKAIEKFINGEDENTVEPEERHGGFTAMLKERLAMSEEDREPLATFLVDEEEDDDPDDGAEYRFDEATEAIDGWFV